MSLPKRLTTLRFSTVAAGSGSTSQARRGLVAVQMVSLSPCFTRVAHTQTICSRTAPFIITRKLSNRAGDQAEIAATKSAAKLLLPVFFVNSSQPRAPVRDVRLAWVQTWDDDQGWFYARFGEQPPSDPPPRGEPETPFTVTGSRETVSRTSRARKRSAAFKFAVFNRYRPAECCVCGIRVVELLDAAHIVGVEYDGTDDPRNGLIFCATHHRAFDANMFAIRPTDLQLISGKRQFSLDTLGIQRTSLSTLSRSPHIDALGWRWERWKQRPK